MPPSGLLNLDKPAGITSRRAVDHVQHLGHGIKVGHAGTLDPLASGVLVLCVGRATRLIEYVQRMPKHYSVTFLLGRQSPTEDIEGEVVELEDPPVPTPEEINEAAWAFTGEIQQRPPAYSALKVSGRRAYDLARKGRTVDLKPRTIIIHRINVVEYRYPELRLNVQCGSGTYVRSLGRDLAGSLGTMAVMSALKRTAVGAFRVDEAVAPKSLARDNWMQYLLPLTRAVENLPKVTLNRHQVLQVASGQTISCGTAPPDTDEIAALDSSGQLVALLARRGPGRFRPARVLVGK